MPDSDESPKTTLRELIALGNDPDAATDMVLRGLPPEWAMWVRAFVHREARRMESARTNAALKAALLPELEGGRVRPAVKLEEVVYHTADGKRVVWAELTLDQIRHKIAMLRKQLGSLAGHIDVLEAAATVIEESGGTELTPIGEVPGWEERMREVLERRDIGVDDGYHVTMPG